MQRPLRVIARVASIAIALLSFSSAASAEPLAAKTAKQHKKLSEKSDKSEGRAKKKADPASAKPEKAKPEKPAKSKPKVDTKGLGVLARTSTKFNPGEARAKNIRRIAELVDGAVVQPGQTFNVNQFVGPRTEENGFVLAPSILELEYTETVGGGVSQFATTLYEAVYDAGFPIVEHKPHSHYISRYPAGVEATLSWPAPNLVFKNDSASPLVIRATVSKDRISVKLVGQTPGRKVERKRPVDLERKPPPVELVGDDTVAPSKQKVERPGSPRRSVQITRVVSNPGHRRVEEEVVVYVASKRVVHVHPCKLPRGHKGYTGEPCEKAKKHKSSDG